MPPALLRGEMVTMNGRHVRLDGVPSTGRRRCRCMSGPPVRGRSACPESWPMARSSPAVPLWTVCVRPEPHRRRPGRFRRTCYRIGLSCSCTRLADPTRPGGSRASGSVGAAAFAAVRARSRTGWPSSQLDFADPPQHGHLPLGQGLSNQTPEPSIGTAAWAQPLVDRGADRFLDLSSERARQGRAEVWRVDSNDPASFSRGPVRSELGQRPASAGGRPSLPRPSVDCLAGT